MPNKRVATSITRCHRNPRSPASDTLFADLLPRPGFRADLLYFIRLAGNYAASIVIDCRSRASHKHKAEFARWLGLDVGKERAKVVNAESPKALEERLWNQFLERNPAFLSPVDKRPNVKKDIWKALAFGEPWFDVFKTDFPTLMSKMPDRMRERLSRALQKDHLLPWETRQFLTAVEDLTTYRHWLEHPQDRIAKGDARPSVGDGRVLEILGLMLLPFLGNHLVGRIRHHGRRIGLRAGADIADCAREILRKSLASRRETSKFMNGLKRRIDNDTIRKRITEKYGNPPSDAAVHRIAKEERKKRNDLEKQKAAMLALHRRYFEKDTWPRYNHENFLMRFAFIGRRRIGALEEKLDIAGQEHPDFINAIEPAFMLSMDMALVIHVWLTELADAGVEIKKEKIVGPIVPALRNAIAHGDWLWDIVDKSRNGQIFTFAELLQALLALPQQGRLNDVAQRRNDLLTRLEGVLRPCGRTHVYGIAQAGDDPNRMPARHIVKRWGCKDREKFADRARWRLEKRMAVRRLAAAWMRDIASVRQSPIKS